MPRFSRFAATVRVRLIEAAMVVGYAWQVDEGALPRCPRGVRGGTAMLARMNEAAHHRLFFALSPDADVRARLAAAAQAEALPADAGGRRVRPERLHLTLHFLGAVPGDRVNAVRDAGGAVDAKAFELVLDRAGGFTRARVAWLGCTHVPDALIALHRQLGDALTARGLGVESRPYAPHVTVRRDVRSAAPDSAIEPIVWPVAAFVLIDSRADRGYVEVARWPLRR